MRHPKPTYLLTETELELMLILWMLGQATVREVQENLPSERARAYTSVATILKILDDKGFVSSSKEGRFLVYRPCVMKSEYQERLLSHLVEHLFDSRAVTIVEKLIELKMVSKSDLGLAEND